MNVVSFSDLAQVMMNQSALARLRDRSTTISQELSTGHVADVGSALGGDQRVLADIRRTRDLNTSYAMAIKDVSLNANAAQEVFKSISQLGEDLGKDLALANTNQSDSSIALTATRGRVALEAALGGLNVQLAGKSLFGGDAALGPVVGTATEMLTAITAFIGPIQTPQALMARITEWFNDPAEYDNRFYQGGAARQNVDISGTESVWLGATGKDPEIKRALIGFASSALLGDPRFNFSRPDQVEFATLSANAMRAGTDSITALSAKIGLSQERIATIGAYTKAEAISLEMAEAALTASDPERLAVELEAITTNIQMLYQITTKLTGLSLSDYIR